MVFNRMSLSLRFVVVDQKGEVLRLSNARFERLLARPPQDSIPEFAGKRLRAAEIVVHLEQRRPVAVCRICYYHLNFDGKGFVDYEQYLKEGMVPMLVSPDAGLPLTVKTVWYRPPIGSQHVVSSTSYGGDLAHGKRQPSMRQRWELQNTTAYRSLQLFSASPETHRRLYPGLCGGIVQAPWPNPCPEGDCQAF